MKIKQLGVRREVRLRHSERLGETPRQEINALIGLCRRHDWSSYFRASALLRTARTRRAPPVMGRRHAGIPRRQKSVC